MNTKMKSKQIMDSYKKYIKNFGSLDLAFIVIICVLLSIAPLFRGLYFRENYIPYVIITSVVFIAYMGYLSFNKKQAIRITALDLVLLLFPLMYLVSSIFAINSKDALDSVLIYSAYFLLYKIISSICVRTNGTRIFANGILFSIFITAIASLASAAGIINYQGVMVAGRFNGVYQYANVTAAILGAGMLLASGLLIGSSKLISKLYYQLVLVTIFITFIFTLSRGALIVFFLVYAIYFIFVNPKEKISLLMSIVILIISSAPFIYKLFDANASGSYIIYYVMSLVISLLLQVVKSRMDDKILMQLRVEKLNRFLIALMLVVACIMAVVFFVRVPLEYKVEHAANDDYLWNNKMIFVDGLKESYDYVFDFNVMTNKLNENSYGILIESIDTKGEAKELAKNFGSASSNYENKHVNFTTLEDTSTVRISMYNNLEKNTLTSYKDISIIQNDGKVVKKYERLKYLPDQLGNRLLDINLQTQSAFDRIYFSKDGLKVFKDYFLTGIGGGGWDDIYRQYQSYPYDTKEVHNYYLQLLIELGMLGLIIIVLLLYFLLRGFYFKLIKEHDAFTGSIFAAAFMILIHAAIDFDLSLGAASYLLWSLIGLCSAGYKYNEVSLKNKKVPKYALVTISLLLLYTSSSIYMGMVDGKNAAQFIKSNKAEEALVLYDKAIKKDWFNCAYSADYLQILTNRSVPTGSGLIEKSINRIEKYEPNNSLYTSVIVNSLLKTGKFEKAMVKIEQDIQKRPLNGDAYLYKLNVNYEIANYYFKNSEHKLAIPYLDNMINTEMQLQEAQKKSLREIRVDDKFNKFIRLAHNWKKNAEIVIENES